MSCRTLHERLADFVAGRLTADSHRTLVEHTRRCPACAELVAFARGDSMPDDSTEPDAAARLTAAILARTSGSACTRAEDLLCSHTDGALEPVDRALVEQHLDGCPSCAGLAAALARMARVLPALAELDPGAGFAEGVLAATLPRETRHAVQASTRPERWRAFWQRLLARPRVAWELAYVGTFVLALVFLTPGSPLAEVPDAAIGLARKNPIDPLREPVTRLEEQMSTRVRSGLQVAERRALDLRAVAEGRLEGINARLGTFWERLASKKANEEDASSAPSPETDSNEVQGAKR